jgi:hypothetical protein
MISKIIIGRLGVSVEKDSKEVLRLIEGHFNSPNNPGRNARLN